MVKQNPHIQVSCKQNNFYNSYIDHNSYVLIQEKNSSPSNKSNQLHAPQDAHMQDQQ